MRAVLIAAPLLVLAMPAHAQTDTDSQVWTTVEASTALDDGVKLTLEAIGRFGDDADGLYELEFGGWLGFDAGDGVTISTGYVRVPGYSHGDLSKMEDRPRQQISFPLGGFAGGSWSGRCGLGERLGGGGVDLGCRLSRRTNNTMPLGPGRKTPWGWGKTG